MLRTDIKGKTSLVTGADSGIGLCFCKELAHRGSNLVMISNRPDELIEASTRLASEYGVRTYPFFCDLTDPKCHDKILDFIDANNLEIELLINNAGIFSFDMVDSTPERKINCFIDLHCRAITLLSQAFGARFKERGHGHILNMSSMSCWTPMPGIAMYSATKAYIRVFSRALHYELRDNGVYVTVAVPGGIATDLFGLPQNLMRIAVAIGAVQRPEKFVKVAINKTLKGKKQYINGFINRLAIFFVGITPTCVRMLIKRKMLDKGIRR